ncbi:MAG: ornithine cyclodeaminase [Alphaproteobacteria bacterium]|nr:ornithine cyclodeaminase [Alphaproteobacteria bacterium]
MFPRLSGRTEIDSETLRRSKFFVDDRAQTFSEKGEFLIPMQEGVVDEGHILADLGQLVAGKTDWRRQDTDLTVFGSGGTAIEYLGTVVCLYKAALETGVGTDL